MRKQINFLDQNEKTPFRVSFLEFGTEDRIPSLLVQALSNRKYHHLYQHMLVDVR